MKIKNELNNIFEQYDVEENRLTNAFLHTLTQNPSILKSFLQYSYNIHPNKKTEIVISSQKEPFGLGDRADGGKQDIESIPDGWIIIDENKAIVLETKIRKNTVKQGQLKAHAKRIRDYPLRYLCVITPDEESPIEDLMIEGVESRWISWKQIYVMITREKKERGLPEYFRKQLKEYLSMKEDLVGFQGIEFPEEFDSKKAKNILKALVKEIKTDIVKIYPELIFERSKYSREIHAHTVHHRSVGSFFATDKDFTKDMHLTLWLSDTHMGIAITISNNSKKRWKRLKAIFGSDESFSVFKRKLTLLRKKLPNLYLEFVHRHYMHQQDAFVDGLIEMDWDTVKGIKPVKRNIIWLEAIKDLVINKKGFNGQLMIRSRFFYNDHPKMKTAEFKNIVVEAARSFKDVFEYLK